MSSHAQVAKRVRLRKEKYPKDYCKVKTCLYRTKDTPFEGSFCPKHKGVCYCEGLPLVHYTGECSHPVF
jgi:hypothetical protein